MREVNTLREWLHLVSEGELECKTASGAISYLGALYLKEWIEIARELYPAHQSRLWVECDTDIAGALATIRHELPNIVVSGDNPVGAKLKDMAEQSGITLDIVS